MPVPGAGLSSLPAQELLAAPWAPQASSREQHSATERCHSPAGCDTAAANLSKLLFQTDPLQIPPNPNLFVALGCTLPYWTPLGKIPVFLSPG